MPDEIMGDVEDIRLQKEKKRLTRFRVWYFLIIIVAAGLVGAGLYFYITGSEIPFAGDIKNLTGKDQTAGQESVPVDTSDWKTYTDTDLGYAFKYPSLWDIDVAVTKATGAYDQVSQVRINPDMIINDTTKLTEAPEFWATVYNQKYSKYIAARKKDKKFKEQKSEKATLASQDGTKFIFIATAFDNRQQNDLVFALGTGKTIILSYFTGTEETDNITSILKSFRFSE